MKWPDMGTTTKSLRQVLTYLGPGFFVTIGFIDPGNWATNVSAGSDFGYELLWVVTLGTLLLILWQHMAAHLGIVTGECLAHGVQANMRAPAAALYGTTAMAACIATAVAEILGAAIGINLLFPALSVKVAAVIATILVWLMVRVQHYRSVEKLVLGFVTAIGLCYLVELVLVKPDWGQTALHLVTPRLHPHSIYLAMAVLGAVVMPHNLYLHSEVIRSRQHAVESEEETRRRLRYEFVDTLLAMLAGLAINAAMIIVAAAVFHRHHVPVHTLPEASATLRPLIGPLAGLAFGLGLLFAGVASSVTAAIAGGTTFSGYLGRDTSLQSPWFRGGLLLTLLPACGVVMLVRDALPALILSQVVLSLQLPLTMLPLYLLTSSRKVMGTYANGRLEGTAMQITGLLVLALNVLLVLQLLGLWKS
jgi:manganese transport protein